MVMPAPLAKSSKRVTIRNQSVGVSLPVSMWRLFDQLAQAEKLPRDEAMAAHFERWAESTPLGKRRVFTFERYLLNAIPEQAVTALTAQANPAPVTKLATISLVVQRDAGRNMLVDLRFWGTERGWTYSKFQGKLRYLEGRARNLIFSVSGDTALLYDVNSAVDRDYFEAKGLWLPKGELGEQLVKEVFEDCAITWKDQW